MLFSTLLCLIPPKSYRWTERAFLCTFTATFWQSCLLFSKHFLFLLKLLTSSLLFSHLIYLRRPTIPIYLGLWSLGTRIFQFKTTSLLSYSWLILLFQCYFSLIPKNTGFPWPIQYSKLALYNYLISQQFVYHFPLTTLPTDTPWKLLLLNVLFHLWNPNSLTLFSNIFSCILLSLISLLQQYFNHLEIANVLIPWICNFYSLHSSLYLSTLNSMIHDMLLFIEQAALSVSPTLLWIGAPVCFEL